VGDQPETRPLARGFDECCGLMYSNDMWEFHPEKPEYWGQWPLQYWENDPYEKVNVIDKYPQVAAKFQQFAEQHKNKFYIDGEY